MAGATLTTVNNILKEMYKGPVIEQLNNKVLITQRLETRSDVLVGKFAVVPLHTGRSGGIGGRQEGGALPTAGNQAFLRAQYDLKYLYGRGQITGPSIAKTKSDVGSFVRILEEELTGLKNDLGKDLARQLYGDGTAAIVAALAAGSSTTVAVLAKPDPIIQGQLYVNMVIDVGTLAAPTLKYAGAIISAVTVATPSVTVSIAQGGTPANTDFIFRAGNALATSVSNEVSGLRQVIPTAATDFGGIVVASNTIWDNIRKTGAALSQDLMMQCANSQLLAGGELSAIITSLGIQRQYFGLLQSQVRFADYSMLHGGFKSLDFQGVPVIADIDAPFGNMYFLDESSLFIFADGEWDYLQEDGNVLKYVPGFDAWEFVLARYMNLGANQRNNQVVLSGLPDATGV